MNLLHPNQIKCKPGYQKRNGICDNISIAFLSFCTCGCKRKYLSLSRLLSLKLGTFCSLIPVNIHWTISNKIARLTALKTNSGSRSEFTELCSSIAGDFFSQQPQSCYLLLASSQDMTVEVLTASFEHNQWILL